VNEIMLHVRFERAARQQHGSGLAAQRGLQRKVIVRLAVDAGR
jgi:hypothetical protein